MYKAFALVFLDKGLFLKKYFRFQKISLSLQSRFREANPGEMLEWLKRHAWKACILQKGIPSSNLGLSANSLVID